MRDCDIVFRLDPDMLFTDHDWKLLVDLVRNTKFDAYRMDFKKDSINYYMTGDFNHGLKDAQEYDPLAVNPNLLFTGVLDYPGESKIIDIPGFICHHFRGWQKPKSTPSDWADKMVSKEYVDEFGDNGGWYKCPEEIKNKMESWMKELEEMKK